MKKNRKITAIYLFCAFVLTVAAAVLRTVALNNHYEIATGYFLKSGAITVANWLIVAVVLGAASYLFVADKRKKYVATYSDSATFISSSLVALSLIFVTFELFADLLKPLNSTKTAILATNFICIVLAVFAALAFVLTAIISSRRSATRATYQILAVLFLSVYAAYIYFTNPYPINNLVSITDMMAYLLAAVFFLFEVRISLGRDLWHFYTSFGIITAAVCFYSSVPTIIDYFMNGRVVSSSIAQAILAFAIFIFVSLRLVRSLYLFEDTEAKTVSAIRQAEDAARIRSKGENESESPEEQFEEENENYTIEIDTDRS